MTRRPQPLDRLLPAVLADLARRHGINPPTTLTDRNTDMTTGFSWEEPPPAAFAESPSSKWTGVADQLRAHPNQWAKLDIGEMKNPKTFAYNVKNGATKAWRPQGAFEAVCTPDRQVYARYVGDAEAGAA